MSHKENWPLFELFSYLGRAFLLKMFQKLLIFVNRDHRRGLVGWVVRL